MLLFSLFFSLVASAQSTDLSFRALELKTDEGHVICTLYDSESSWLQDPGYRAVTKAKPVGGAALCVFSDVPPGIYAISFIHDVNDNGDMDSNFFGFPREPWGMSRDPTIRFGPPAFDKSAFSHPSTEPVVGRAR